MWELPPNGQGITALQMLNLLEGFDLKALGPSSPDFWHLLVETKKIAFEDRARFIADPSMAKIPVTGLLSRDYARERARAARPCPAAREQPPVARDPATGVLSGASESRKDGCALGY